MANWANVGNVGDPRSPGWLQKNLTTIEPVPGQTWQVYKPAAQAFEGLLRDLAASGYPLKSSGGYNYRNIGGSNRLSQHAFGTAIDLNAAANPRVAPGASLVTDLPPNINDMARKYNLEWGGNWRRPDAMHFEYTGAGGAGGAGPGAGVGTAAPTSGVGALMAGEPTGGPAGGFQAPFGDLVAPTGVQTSLIPPTDIASLGYNFLQQAEDRRAREASERDAQEQRRIALFSAPAPTGVAGLYA